MWLDLGLLDPLLLGGLRCLLLGLCGPLGFGFAFGRTLFVSVGKGRNFFTLARCCLSVLSALTCLVRAQAKVALMTAVVGTFRLRLAIPALSLVELDANL